MHAWGVSSAGPFGDYFVAAAAPGEHEATVTAKSNDGLEGTASIKYMVAKPQCTTAVGKGQYLKPGDPGHFSVSNTLSKNLNERQILRVNKNSSEARFRLSRLLTATCEGAPGEREFRGVGEGTKEGEPGYDLHFRLYEEGVGHFFFHSELMKGSVLIETNGGPLKPTSEAIS